MWRATLKGIAAHKLRLVLTAISVVVAVSFISGTYVLTDTVKGTFSALFSDLNRGVDLRVASATGFGNGDDAAPMPAEVAARGGRGRRRRVRGRLGPVLLRRRADGRRRPRVRATRRPRSSPTRCEHQELSAFSYRQGRAPTAPDEVAIDVSSADRAHLHAGDTITVTGAGTPVPARIVGLLGLRRRGQPRRGDRHRLRPRDGAAAGRPRRAVGRRAGQGGRRAPTATSCWPACRRRSTTPRPGSTR